jgi:tetratricopeptide (TPR) repeat protein
MPPVPRHPRGVPLLAIVTLLCLGGAGTAQAQDLLRPPVLVVEDLLGDDFKAAKRARRELTQIGARAIPSILEARGHKDLPRTQRAALDGALREIVDVLATSIAEGLEVQARPGSAQGALGGAAGAIDPARADEEILALNLDELGDLGSLSGDQPTEAGPKRDRARRSRAALVLLGPFLTGAMLRVPPLRDAPLTRALGELAQAIYARERALAKAATEPASRAAFRARYLRRADLAVPLVAAGTRDADPIVRAHFQAIRDRALEASLDALAATDAERRERAEDVLYQLEGLAQLSLSNVAAGRDPKHTTAHEKSAATRLLRRIRFGLSRALIRRLGHDLDGYGDLPFRERRERVFEIGRLGGAEAIPCLRSILREEPSLQVKVAAAVGLIRQRDPIGTEWFARHGMGLPRLGLTKRELAAVHMDQGLKHLTHARFPRAEREFQRVIEVEPRNEIAWYNLACTYSRWNKVDAAMEALRKAVGFGFDDTKHMGKDPDLENIRDDPRFKALVAEIERARGEGDDDDDDDEAPPPRTPE